MKKIKTILIPTDFSQNADRAVEYAIANFASPDVCFWLIHVYHVYYTGAVISIDLDELLQKEREKSLKEEVDALKVKYPDITIESRAIQGWLVDVVTKLVDTQSIDLVVMGTKGASGVKGVLLGSNAANIMRNSTAPVILVPDSPVVKSIKRILFATDLQYINGFNSIQPLHALAKESGAKIEILHISDVIPDPIGMNKEELRLSTVFNDVDHEFHFRNQVLIEDDILDYAHEIEADLIVVVSRQYGFFYRMLHRSVSRKLSMHTDIPVMILKEQVK
jgi:nucleotide-binding universal stress UspA family protein